MILLFPFSPPLLTYLTISDTRALLLLFLIFLCNIHGNHFNMSNIVSPLCPMTVSTTLHHPWSWYVSLRDMSAVLFLWLWFEGSSGPNRTEVRITLKEAVRRRVQKDARHLQQIVK